MSFRRASRFPGSTIVRDVLPAPPSGGAPRLPRPSSALRHEGGHGVDLGDARSRSASRPVSREIGQLLWGSAPLRALSCVRTERRRLAYSSFRSKTLRAVHLGVDAPSPEHPRPLLSPLRRPPSRRAFALRQVPRVVLVSVAELGRAATLFGRTTTGSSLVTTTAPAGPDGRDCTVSVTRGALKTSAPHESIPAPSRSSPSSS